MADKPNYLIIVDELIQPLGLPSRGFVVHGYELPHVGETWSEADERMAQVLAEELLRRTSVAPVYPLDAATGFEVTSGGTRHGALGGEDAGTPAGGGNGAGGLGDGHQARASE